MPVPEENAPVAEENVRKVQVSEEQPNPSNFFSFPTNMFTWPLTGISCLSRERDEEDDRRAWQFIEDKVMKGLQDSVPDAFRSTTKQEVRTVMRNQ